MDIFCLPTITAPTTPIWWPVKLPGATAIQTFDVSTLPMPLAPGQITALTAQIAPSGAGELSGASLSLTGTTISLTESSGVGGRVYSILFTATLTDDEVVQWIIQQGVGLIPPPNIIPPPPDPGFGAEIVWMPTSNTVASTTLTSGIVLSIIPCSIASVRAAATSVSGWAMLIDAAEIPSAGAVIWNDAWEISPGTPAPPPRNYVPPMTMVNGAVLLFSANANPYVYTPSATATLSGEVL